MLLFALAALWGASLLPANEAQVKFQVVGDWGHWPDTVAQQRVADQMGLWAEANGCDFIVSTGDNFYPDGVTSNQSDRFDYNWYNVYTNPAIADLDWYLTVGNHDHYETYRELYQVEFSTYEPRWNFPDLWHSFYISTGNANIHFIASNTQVLRETDKYDKQIMLDWMERELVDSTGDWIIVIGHHPPVSAGGRWGDQLVLDDMVPMMEQYGVHLYLAGHDHNLQHITKTEDYPTGIHYVVSGGGGRGIYEYSQENHDNLEDMGYQLHHFGECYGFVAFVMDETSATFTFLDDLGDVLYEYTVVK